MIAPPSPTSSSTGLPPRLGALRGADPCPPPLRPEPLRVARRWPAWWRQLQGRADPSSLSYAALLTAILALLSAMLITAWTS